MQLRSSQPTNYEDAQMLTKMYDKQIPIEVEASIFSDASFHNKVYTALSEKQKYGSVECPDAIDTASLEMNEKAKNNFPSLVSLVNFKEQTETLLTTTPAYFNGV
jgi:hypothetical protein